MAIEYTHRKGRPGGYAGLGGDGKVPAGQLPGGDGQPVTAGSAFTVTQMPNSVTGDGVMNVMVFPPGAADIGDVVLAVAQEGDDFPRIILTSKFTGGYGLLVGDGTADPANGTSLYGIEGRPGFRVYGDVEFDGAFRGPVLKAPDASLHRIQVANDGTLSTEAVL